MELTFTIVLIPGRSGAVGGERVQPELLIILVVEDEVLVQDFIEVALSEGGFGPQIVSSGEDAVTLLQGEKGNSYRALITDIDLAGRLNGWDVARRARELNPDLPVIYMTGAAADEWAAHGVPNSILLQKPFAPAQVVTAISQLLNQLPPAAPG